MYSAVFMEGLLGGFLHNCQFVLVKGGLLPAAGSFTSIDEEDKRLLKNGLILI